MINVFVPKIKKVLEFSNNNLIETGNNISPFNPYLLTKTENWNKIYYDNQFFRLIGNTLYSKRNFVCNLSFYLRVSSKNLSNQLLVLGLTEHLQGYTSTTGNYKNISLPTASSYYNFNGVLNENLMNNQTFTLSFTIGDILLVGQSAYSIIQIYSTI